MHAIANYGPLAISVDASEFRHYESGIFSGCDYTKNMDINHAVVMVGYGSENG
jgi:cathepsin L